MAVTVYLAASSPTRKAIQEVIPSDQLPLVQLETTTWKQAPKRAHMVLTTNALSSALERWASVHHAYPVVLPEAGKYLALKVRNHLESGEDLVLLDARLAKVTV